MNHDWKEAKGAKSGQRTYSTRSLHGQVVHELGKRIVTGDIDEGEVLPNETELGASFDVSRTALREGIKVLTAKGLLASRTRTGTRVRPRHEWNMLDPDILAWRSTAHDPDRFIQDLVEFRMAVEPLAASLAATRATTEQLAYIEQAYFDMVAAGEDVHAGVEPDLRFHQGILHASGNELLAPLGALIEAALTMSFRLATPAIKLDSFPVHKAVLDAILDRNPQQAHDAMVNLLGYAKSYNTAVLSEMRENESVEA
ncbi:FadR/GntR family transcriptional regulator [Magnetovibrio sp.]|uniref:FadR/GntR family transcriptional regulator n=1 Tax=Magnetovibrio sp. TaxID=2024836 RepID=UPI002F92A2AA